jgi:hypothetical protein
MDTQDALARMTPEAADKELSDVEAQQLKRQETQEAQQQKISNLQYKPPVYPGNGEKAYRYDANGQLARAPQFDKPPGAEAKTEMQLFLTDRPKWNEMQAAKLQFSIAGADTKLLDRANTLYNFKMDKTPIQMVPELKNDVLLNRDTMQPVPTGTVSLREALAPNGKYSFVDRKTGMETIPNLRAGRQAIVTLAQYAAKVLPKGTGSPLNDWVSTYANRWRIPVRAVSGGVNEAMFGAARTAAAMQLQKAFTGSTRPVNLVEFTRITGDTSAGPLTAKDIDAVLPVSRDTKEVAQAKLNVIQQMFDNKLSELNMNSGAPGVYFKSVNEAMGMAASAPPEPAEAPEAPAPAEAPTPDDGGSDL